jgi:hypothetical protein
MKKLLLLPLSILLSIGAIYSAGSKIPEQAVSLLTLEQKKALTVYDLLAQYYESSIINILYDVINATEKINSAGKETIVLGPNELRSITVEQIVKTYRARDLSTNEEILKKIVTDTTDIIIKDLQPGYFYAMAKGQQSRLLHILNEFIKIKEYEAIEALRAAAEKEYKAKITAKNEANLK